MGFIYHATPLGLGLTHVLPISPDRSLEETGAPVARENTVMFSRGVISANLAGDVVKNAT